MNNGLAIELITEYNDWVTQKKITANDVTPEQFMVERAQSTALERLIKLSDELQDWEDDDMIMVGSIREIIDG